MKNIIKRYRVLTLVGLIGIAAILSSCEDDQRYGGREGETMQVAMTISTEFSGVESRAVFEPDRESGTSWDINTVTHCLLLIYNGTGNDAILVDTIKILDPAKMFPMSRVVPAPADGVSYRAIMLGNVLAEQLGDAAVIGAQLKDLNDYAYEITSGYNDPVSNSSTNEFTWSGLLDYKSEASTLGFTLNPNVAKIKVTVTDNSTESNVVKVQVKNVPNKVRFAQNALSKGGNFVDGTVEMTYIDYDIEELDLSDKKGELQTLYWYMPHNEAGDGNRDANPIEAPENATWVEFDGMRTADFLYTDYKIYPGIDEDGVTTYKGLKNFNVKADYQYRLNVNITTAGVDFSVTSTETDNVSGGDNTILSGASVDKVILPTGSNCYMIHPIFSHSAGGTLYELPIHERINEYWNNNWGISTVGDTENAITDDTEWEAYVIWQDIDERAICFADKDGTINETSTVYSGKGKTPVYFKLKNQNTLRLNQTYGNILLGVRNKSTQKTLWSWHLWITDYNPDAAPPYSVAKSTGVYGCNKMWAQNYGSYNAIDLQGGKYLKSGGSPIYTDNTTWGNVQHYMSMYLTSASTEWNTGLYADKWIMDRSIGAMTPNNVDAEEPRDGFALYYQYGRKDPFSYKRTYDIDGKERSAYPTEGAQWALSSSIGEGSYNKGVENPNTFYTGNNSTLWASDAQTSNTWYSPVAETPGYKTIFDPCPPGWCVPKSDVFSLGIKSNTTTRLKDLSDYTTAAARKTAFQSAHQTMYIWVRCDANGNMNYPRRHFAMIKSTGAMPNDIRGYWTLDTMFPIQGFINGSTGVLDWVASGGTMTSLKSCMWVADAPSGTYAPMIYIKPGTTSNAGTTLSRTQTTRQGFPTMLYAAKMSQENFISSRGQHIRCIQEPKK